MVWALGTIQPVAQSAIIVKERDMVVVVVMEVNLESECMSSLAEGEALALNIIIITINPEM